MIKGSWSCQTEEFRWPTSLDFLGNDKQISSFQRYPVPRKKSCGARKDRHNKSENNSGRKTSWRTLQPSFNRQNPSHALLHPASRNPGKKPRSAYPLKIPTHFDRAGPTIKKTDVETSGFRKTHRIAETRTFPVQESHLAENSGWGNCYF